MNKIKSLIAATSVAVLTLPALVLAVTPEGLEEGYQEVEGGDSGLARSSFYDILNNLLMYLLGIIGVLAIVGFVISGIMYITAAGDEDRIDMAKKMLTFSIIGLVVALLGLVIVTAIGYIIK